MAIKGRRRWRRPSQRHKDSHLREVLARAQETGEVARADTLLDQLRSLQERTLSILTREDDSGALGVALGAIKEARGNLELEGKLLGQLQQEGTVNILLAPEWLAVRAAVMDVLRQWPEARAALAERLALLEGGR